VCKLIESLIEQEIRIGQRQAMLEVFEAVKTRDLNKMNEISLKYIQPSKDDHANS
jgi:hypothetical protein